MFSTWHTVVPQQNWKTKMLTLNHVTDTSSYAHTRNAEFSINATNAIGLHQRWYESINNLDADTQAYVSRLLSSTVCEFKLRNPNVTQWSDLQLCDSLLVPLGSILIDTTMQRLLDVFWVMVLLSKFDAIKIAPIQVYIDSHGRVLAWDGQHTAILLWIVATHILRVDPNSVMVPVVRYRSSQKSKMRECFIAHNSNEGKKYLETIDQYMQMVFGVRLDKSQNPDWIKTEQKQQHLEACGLFVTAAKFNDTYRDGAISRLQEINKLQPDTVGWLARYLGLVTQGQRAVGEKEMVMMAHYFELCAQEKIPVTTGYLLELATVTTSLFNADFDPNSVFWIKSAKAYYNWHSRMDFDSSIMPRFKKEPLHGMPFLIAQLNKSFTQRVPRSKSGSNFVPAAEDLF